MNTAVSAERTPSESTGNVSNSKKTTIPIELGNTLTILASRLSVVLRKRVTYQDMAVILECTTDENLFDLITRYKQLNGDNT